MFITILLMDLSFLLLLKQINIKAILCFLQTRGGLRASHPTTPSSSLTRWDVISSALSTFIPNWVGKKKGCCTLSSGLVVNFLTVAWFWSRVRAHLLKVWMVMDWLDRINCASLVCRRRFKQHAVQHGCNKMEKK